MLSGRELKNTLSRAIAVALLLVLSIGARPLQTKSLTFATGEAELFEGGSEIVLSVAETEEDYQKRVAKLTQLKIFVPMKRKPAHLSPAARFGINLVFEGHNLSWALDGDEQKGYVLYADLNANGDLSDDQPMRFEQKDGQHSLLFRTTDRDGEKWGRDAYPALFKLRVSWISPRGESPQLALLCNDHTLRRGVIQMAGQDLAFGLIGSRGIYNEDYQAVAFDLNGDGQLDLKTNDSPEFYLLSEKYVNVGETSYEFAADRYGRSLTLKPLAEKLPPRPGLLAGITAPDFTFTDMDGKTHRLSDYRGKMVLLDFWGTWCKGCVAETQELVKAYEKFHEKGFEILGIDTHDTEMALRKFLTERKVAWAQTREQEDGPLQKLYRVVGFPTHFLIGKNGTIVANRINIEDLTAILEKQLSTTAK